MRVMVDLLPLYALYDWDTYIYMQWMYCFVDLVVFPSYRPDPMRWLKRIRFTLSALYVGFVMPMEPMVGHNGWFRTYRVWFIACRVYLPLHICTLWTWGIRQRMVFWGLEFVMWYFGLYKRVVINLLRVYALYDCAVYVYIWWRH